MFKILINLIIPEDYLYCDAHPEEVLNGSAAPDPLTYSRRLGSSFNLTYECCEYDA